MKNNRFLNIPYLLFTVRIKVLKLLASIKNVGKTPYLKASVKNKTYPLPPYKYKYDTKYIALSHFDYQEASHFYQKDKFLTTDIILALIYWNEENRSIDKFLTMVDKIDAQKVESNNYLLFLFEEKIKYNVNYPWMSAIVQGKAASLYLRAHECTQDKEYLNKARKCLLALHIPIREEGCFRVLKNSAFWAEEYPDKDKPSMVLNGHLFTLIGLSEYISLTEDTILINLYRELLHSTLMYLSFYRVPNGLLYSLSNWTYCNVHYLGIMQPLIKHIYTLSGCEEFQQLNVYIKKLCPDDIFAELLGIDKLRTYI